MRMSLMVSLPSRVVEGGRIVESGRHADLVKKKNGLYKKLFDMQFRI